MRIRNIPGISPALVVLTFCSLSFGACRSERALWIEATSADGHRTTIAVTEGIVRQYVDSKETKVNFEGSGKDELVTKEMLRDVLNGRRRSIEKHDDADGSGARVYMKTLSIPGGGGGTDRLVIETFKNGERLFHLALPEIEMESRDAESGSDTLVKGSFGWKKLLPFLAKEGGAIYIKDENDHTEIWVYVE